MKTDDSSRRVSRPWGRILKHRDGGYMHGVVVTKHGIVDVYSQDGDPYTNIRIVIDGRLYERSINKAYTERGLATIAARFATEMAELDTP